MNYFRAIWRLFKKPKYKVFNSEVAVEAFQHNGKRYYHFQDSFKMPAGRTLCALAFYEELRMRCNREYLEKHIKATEVILSDPKKINIGAIALMNANLKERLSLVPFPDHIYKLASVTFFDETENPASYDFAYNQKKIAGWKKDPALLDFFLQTQFQDLIPFSNLHDESAKMYFQVADQIDQMHQNSLQEVLSRQN